MEHNNIYKLFKDNKEKPEASLSRLVWQTISIRQAKENQIASWSYTFVGAGSLVWLVFAIKDLLLQFSQSGFYEYLSLAFSDGGSVALHFKEFALSLADSLPVTSLLFSLLSIFILFISIRKVSRQFRSQLSLA